MTKRPIAAARGIGASLGVIVGAVLIWLQREDPGADPDGWYYLFIRAGLCALIVGVPAAAVLGVATAQRSYKKSLMASLAAGALVGVFVGLLIMSFAWSHNPQLSVHGGDEGVAWGYLFGLGAWWSVMVGAPAMAVLSALAAIGTAISRRRAGPTED